MKENKETLERRLATDIANHWYKELHGQHSPILQKQLLAEFIESKLEDYLLD